MKESLKNMELIQLVAPKDSRINYVVDFLNNHTSTPSGVKIELVKQIKKEQKWTIFYKNTPTDLFEKQWLIPAQELIFSENIYPSLMLSANAYQWQNFSLWSVEKRAAEHRQFVDNQRFGFDILETLFFHLSRYEEYHAPYIERDWNDELPSHKHFLVQNGLHHQPVVDHLVYCFWQSLGFEIEKKETTFRLSHDIDALQKFANPGRTIRAFASGLKHQKDLKVLKKLGVALYQTKRQVADDPFDTFDWFLTEKSIEKIIYFMAGGETKFDNFYQIDDAATVAIIEKAAARGYEIGLHPSYNTYIKEDLFFHELQKLASVSQRKITKNRMHYLRFSFRHTLGILDKLGIQEDSTMGYQDVIGFRCGTGFGYRMFDFTTNKATNFLEVPMVVMDCGLLVEVNYDVEKAQNLLNQFLADNEFLTKITFNFHNSTFDPARLDEKAFKAFYLALGTQIK